MPNEITPLPAASRPERSVLSSCMQDDAESFIDLAVDAGITPKHFSVPAHGDLFRTLQSFRADGRQVEMVDLTESLKDRGLLENMGGRAEILSIFSESPTSAHFDHHLQIVKTKYLQRRMISLASQGVSEAYSAEPAEAADKLQDLIDELTSLRDSSDSDKNILTNKELLSLCIDDMAKRLGGEENNIIPTPWSGLNRHLGGGLGVGEITILAARPSKGKTAFAMNIMEKAVVDDTPSLMISLESSELRLGYRMAAQTSGVNLRSLVKEKPTKMELQDFQSMVGKMREKPFFIRKIHNGKASDITSCIRTAVRDHGVKLVAIDYLQRIQPANSAESANVRLRLDNALSALCPLADQLGIALLILVQLNREAEGVSADQLNQSMLKETSQIEQDADVIMMLGDAFNHEGEGTEGEDDYKKPITCMIPKNRDGATSYARLLFHGATTKFSMFHSPSPFEPSK